MKVTPHPKSLAAVFVPDGADDPEDLLDVIDEHAVRNVVLDLSAVPSEVAAQFLKAAGPQIPDADLRIVLSEAGFATARALNLTAFFDWYPSV
jgi:hypothetical protein